MAKRDSKPVEKQPTEIFELVGQNIEDLALALTLAAQALEEGIVGPEALLNAFSKVDVDDELLVH